MSKVEINTFLFIIIELRIFLFKTIRRILTKIFGWKYYIAVYEVYLSSSQKKKGYLELRIRRLSHIDINWLKKYLAKKNSWEANQILLLNVIRVDEIDGNWEINNKEDNNDQQ